MNKIVRWGPRLRAWMTNGEGEGQRVSEGRALRAERACGSMVRASRGLIIQWAKAHFPTAEAVGLSKASSSSALRLDDEWEGNGPQSLSSVQL